MLTSKFANSTYIANEASNMLAAYPWLNDIGSGPGSHVFKSYNYSWTDMSSKIKAFLLRIAIEGSGLLD